MMVPKDECEKLFRLQSVTVTLCRITYSVAQIKNVRMCQMFRHIHVTILYSNNKLKLGTTLIGMLSP